MRTSSPSFQTIHVVPETRRFSLSLSFSLSSTSVPTSHPCVRDGAAGGEPKPDSAGRTRPGRRGGQLHLPARLRPHLPPRRARQHHGDRGARAQQAGPAEEHHQHLHPQPERGRPLLPALLRTLPVHHLHTAHVGAGRLHLQVHPLLLHRLHARQHLHAVGHVRGPLRGHRARQKVVADPRGQERGVQRAAHLAAVPGHGGSRGALPEHRGAGEQQHVLLGGLAGPPEEGLRGVHLRFRIPAAPHAHIRLLRQGELRATVAVAREKKRTLVLVTRVIPGAGFTSQCACQ